MNQPADTPKRLYDRNFMFALASQVSFVIANTLMAHYARWIEFLGGSLRQVGYVMGASAVVGLLLRPWLAQWINRLGSRVMWGVGYAVFAVASLGNLLIDDVGIAMYVFRSGLMLGAAIVFASGLTYITQTAPENRRTEAIGILGAGGFIGMMIGPWLGDFVLGSGSLDTAVVRQRSGFVTLFVAAAAANLVPAFFLLLMRTPKAKGSPVAVTLAEFFATVRRHWPGMILLVDFVFGICMAAPFIFVASFIDETPLTMNNWSVIGVFFWCYAGWGLTVRVTLRKLPDAIGPRKVMFAGMLFMATGMFCFCLPSADAPWMIAIPALLAGTGHALTFHTMTSLTIQPFPNSVRGTGSALALMMLDAGTLVGAPVLGWIGDAYGFTALFSTVGACCVLCLLAYGYTVVGAMYQQVIELAGTEV